VSQILFGTDYPYVSVVENANDLMKAGLSPADLKAVETDNAIRLMPRLKT
jgi:predicted TIM-barrel fold metal-dependent hydrolase